MRVIATGVELCGPNNSGCTDFEELAVATGKLATFTVDGVCVDDRLLAGGLQANQNGVVVELLGAYQSVVSDDLIVALDVTNDSDETVILNGWSAEYLTAESRQATASDAIGPDELRSGASAYLALVFPTQGLGGTVNLTGYDADFTVDLEWELMLTAPE